MSLRVVKATTYDVRFPTSRSGAGSDAMNPDPDYSAAYVALETDDPGGLTGHGADLHDRPRHRDLRGRDRGTLAARRRGERRRSRRRPRRAVAAPRHRLAAPLAGAREGGYPPGDGSDRQRRLGPVRQGRGQADRRDVKVASERARLDLVLHPRHASRHVSPCA